MPMDILPLIAGNWKMNGLAASVAELDVIVQSPPVPRVELLICPPATLLASFAARAKASRVHIGGQDCHPDPSGAHTGDIAAEMLKDAGASHVIVGHSERRADHGETDALVHRKAEAAHRAGLVAIVCVGETEAERKAGKATDVVGNQIEGSIPGGATAVNLVVAYEPVWAIGTGVTPTAKDIEQIHGFIRQNLTRKLKGEGSAVRILYGGSLKPANAAEILAIPDVNGGLIGGASLKANDFLAIAAAAPK